jgi:DNA-binding beta-propeller fold protein YncE
MLARREKQWGSAAVRRGAGRRLAPAIAVTAALWGLGRGPAQAQQFLACGVPVTHHLASGETDTYQPMVSGNIATIVDVSDTSGTIGLLKLSRVGCSTCPPPTCTGSTDFGGTVAVSDCVGNDEGDYTIEFNVVGEYNGLQSPENCGVRLSCGVAPANAALNVPGEVDAYTFAGVAGQQVSLTATATGDPAGSLRMRVYGPYGDILSDTCAGTLTFNVQDTGTYTVLVSACVTPSTGPYTIVWQTLPTCPAPVVPASAYVAYPGSGTVGVIDLSTNQTVSIVPGVAPSVGFFSSITASPNNGSAYVTMEGSATISIINTTLNRVVGSINVPISNENANSLRVAMDPEGRYAYAPSDVLGGVAVIDTAKRKIDAVIPVEGIHVENPFWLPIPIAVTPDGKSVYVGTTFRVQSGEGRCAGGWGSGGACTGDSDCTGESVCVAWGLTVIDTASRTVVGDVTGARFGSYEPMDISFNPTATLAYVASIATPWGSIDSTQGELFLIDTASGSIAQSTPLSVTGGIAYSHDGRIGYAVGCAGAVAGSCATSERGTALLIIDMPLLRITNTIPLSAALGGDHAAGVALSPDGGRLVVTSPDTGVDWGHGIAVIDTATLQIAAAIPPAGNGPDSVAIVTPPTGLCTADDQGQTRVTVGELVTAVNYAADGCPTARTSGFTAK